MIRLTAIVLFVAATAASSVVTAGEATKTRAHIEAQLQDFLARADKRDAHTSFWADDLVYTSSSGERFDKAFILSGFDTETSENDEADATAPAMRYSGEDVDIRLYGDTAIVAFKLVGTPSDGALRLEYFNTGTLLKRNGVWQVVAWQATKIPAATS